MASSNDSTGKGPGRPVREGPKKPSALLDLKPSEVELKGASDAGAKAASSVAAAAAAATGQSATQSRGGSSGSPQPGSPGAGGRSPPPASSSGLRGAATHLVAGLAGGLLALLGADAMMSKLRPGSSETGRASQRLEARIGHLEQLASRPLPPELQQRLAATETHVADLDKTARGIREQQERLAGETRALGAKVNEASAAAPSTGADAARLARLEEIMGTLSEAAKDPQAGRVPQLAAIAGKLADLETSLATQIAQLRQSVTQEVDSRLSQSSEAAQAARAGTQRLDREFAGVRNEAAQITQRVDGLKAQSDRLETGLQGLREQTAALKTDVDRELKQVARSSDVSTALSPLTSKLSLLEQNVQGVVRSEDDRRANVERIVTALELGNLKRTIERGAPFARELAEVRRVAGPKLDLTTLERYRDRGVPSLAELEREFKSVAFQIIDGDKQPAQAHWTDKLIASARSVVRVRKVDQESDDDSIEGRVARLEGHLKGGRLAEVSAEAAKLSERARAPAKAWLDKVEARAAVERSIAVIEQELKASLGAQSQAGKKG